MNLKQNDLAQTTFGVLSIGCLIFASFWILAPFLSAVIWATMVVVATWPLMLGIQARLWGKRSLAVTAMTLILLLVLLLPLTIAIVTIVNNADRIVGWANWLAVFKLPPPPTWVGEIPLMGDKLQIFWQEYAATGTQDLAAQLAPYAHGITKWFVTEAGSIGLLLVQFLLIVIIAAIMYAGGESATNWIKLFGKRLAGDRGESAVVLAGKAIRGVALGVVVTAVVQSALGGIGLLIAGVPLAAVLTAIMFLLCIAQLGPGLVLIPAVIWVFWSGDHGWGTFLLIWALVVVSIDNVLRPYLIKKGADLPLLLIFAGVIGGLLSIGLLGLFVGPVVLAVSYTLLDSWVKHPPS